VFLLSVIRKASTEDGDEDEHDDEDEMNTTMKHMKLIIVKMRLKMG